MEFPQHTAYWSGARAAATAFAARRCVYRAATADFDVVGERQLGGADGGDARGSLVGPTQERVLRSISADATHLDVATVTQRIASHLAAAAAAVDCMKEEGLT